MRKSKQETAETRQRIVETASAEFRSHGIDGTGLAGLMAAAGLTHGGFYKHFESKEQVVEEALTLASDAMVEEWQHVMSAAPGVRGLNAAVADYLSVESRDHIAEKCPFAALGGEIAHGSEAVRDTATKGFLKVVDTIANQLVGLTPAAARKEALWMASSMIGALTMSRVVNDPEISASLLREGRRHLSRAS
jgi:TetR/AcrR family transcriptional regulator, transcriptional repressor for nem operon